MVGALLQLAREHAQPGHIWSLTVEGNGGAYHLTHVRPEDMDHWVETGQLP